MQNTCGIGRTTTPLRVKGAGALRAARLTSLDGAVILVTELIQSPTELVVEVASPAEYAGRHVVSLEALARGPVAVTAPVVAGRLGEGETLDARPALWVFDAGYPPPVLIQEWLRNGLPVATGPSYTQSAADLGQGIAYNEIAANGQTDSVIEVVLAPTPHIATLFQRQGMRGTYNFFDDLATLRQNADGTGAVTRDGDPVGFVLDLSGGGRHWTAATAASRPTLRVVNGRNVLRFDGVNDVLSCAFDVNGDLAITQFVARAGGLGGSSSRLVLNCAHSTGFTGFVERASGTRFEAIIRHQSGAASSSVAVAAGFAASASVFSARFASPDYWRVQRNGALLGEVRGTGVKLGHSTGRTYLGGGPTANFAAMDCHGVALFSQALDDADHRRVETEFMSRMGL